MKKTDVQIDSLPPILAIEEVAELARVKPRTVRDWVRKGLLPSSRLSPVGSARLLFKTRDVLRFLRLEK